MIENQNAYPMNLLVTLDRNYVPQLNVMLFPRSKVTRRIF